MFNSAGKVDLHVLSLKGPSTEEKKRVEDVFNGTEMHPVSPAGLANAE